MSSQTVIEVRNLNKDYVMGTVIVHALRGVSLGITRGEFVAIMGPSGSGKSTFMNILGCLDRPTSGQYFLNGSDVAQMDDGELAAVRNREIGFIFQSFNLLPRTSALKNVELPLVYAGSGAKKGKAEAALERVGLQQRMHHRPNELSGGQQQRVAIARAIVNNPTLILADEPTGNLDSRTGLEILSLFQELNAEGRTIVLVTHEPDVAEHCHRIIRFRDGRLVADEQVEAPLDARKEIAELPVQDSDQNSN